MDYTDPYGTLHPSYKEGETRFKILVREVRTDTPPEWSHELMFIDRKYQDSEGFPVDAVAAGRTWADAFAQAGRWVDEALATDHCIF